MEIILACFLLGIYYALIYLMFKYWYVPTQWYLNTTNFIYDFRLFLEVKKRLEKIKG